MIVNSLTSVSLEPPLVSFCPSRRSLTWQRMRQTRRFGVNVLGEHHEQFALRATPAGANRFDGLEWSPGPGGTPLLTDALAILECRIVAEHAAGDHWIVIGRVDNLRISPDTAPPCSSPAHSSRCKSKGHAAAQLRPSDVGSDQSGRAIGPQTTTRKELTRGVADRAANRFRRVAETPFTGSGGIVRFGARVRRLEFDHALAAEEDPSASALLAPRAVQLVSPRTRERIAACLEHFALHRRRATWLHPDAAVRGRRTAQPGGRCSN